MLVIDRSDVKVKSGGTAENSIRTTKISAFFQ